MTDLPTDATRAAALWLVQQIEPPSLAVPILREKFGLTMLQACQACALASELRRTARA